MKMDKVVGVVDTRTHLPRILKEVTKGSRYIITQRSKAKAVLVGLEEFETLEIMADKQLLKEIKEAKEDIKAGRYKTYEDIFKESLQ
jgi:prevent-host-death family protein